MTCRPHRGSIVQSVRLLLSRADHITAVSGSLIRSLQKSVPDLECRSSVIHTGAPEINQHDDPGEVSSAPCADYMLAVGQLIDRKGIDLLIEALALMVANGADARLVVAGEGPARSKLEQLVVERGLDRSRFLDWRSDPRRCSGTAAGSLVLRARIAGRRASAGNPGGDDLRRSGCRHRCRRRWRGRGGWRHRAAGEPRRPGGSGSRDAEIARRRLAASSPFGGCLQPRAPDFTWPAIAGKYIDLFDRVATTGK